MDKRLIFAVAGSGKTTQILNSIDDEQRSLIITYTNENLRSIERKLVKKYGCVPSHITIQTYFSFLYRFCFRPYFSYLLRDNSFTWSLPGHFPGKGDIRHYVTKSRYVYANRAAKLIIEKGVINEIKNRLTRYYDHFFIDEVQDFAANDFNFLLEFSQAEIDFTLVGDYFQHTFDTSRDGNTRKNLHKNGVEQYLNQFREAGFEVDTESLDKTYRCSPTVCEFISKEIGISISSHRDDETQVVMVDDKDAAIELFKDNRRVKLFLKEHYKFGCYSNNWAKSKGLDSYDDVCVVLNPGTLKPMKNGKLNELKDQTRNKLYVACSRTRGDLYLLDESHLSEFKLG